MSNLEVWNSLCETDPKYTKPFKRPGGFEGTAQNPTYVIKKLTEKFGPCGVGWGINKPEFQFVNVQDGQVLVYCTVSAWHGSKDNVVFGVGGDSAVGSNKYGIKADDEACKKAFTDAIGNAFKFIGVGADLFLGMFDDSKYVNDLKAKFGEEKPKGNGTMGRLADDPTIKADMKELGYDPDKIYNEVMAELDQCSDLDSLSALVKRNKETRRMQGLPNNLKTDFTDSFNKVKFYLENK